MAPRYCKGWRRVGHQTKELLITVYLLGCQQCGGLECGDRGEMMTLCPTCWRRLKADDDAPVYAVVEEETET